MPHNIILWYKNDFYSDKLTLLLKKYMLNHENEILRHLLALMICNAKPRNFEKMISSYIRTIDKNTYFLGDLYSSLRFSYSFDFMSGYELKQTENLIKSCYIKHKTGSIEPGPNSIAKFDLMKGELPKRNNSEDL